MCIRFGCRVTCTECRIEDIAQLVITSAFVEGFSEIIVTKYGEFIILFSTSLKERKAVEKKVVNKKIKGLKKKRIKYLLIKNLEKV